MHLWIILLSSCGSKPTDLRTLAPAETLVYLETNDLGAALQPIIDSKPFTEAAKSKPDLSALKGVQLAVAITGFETKEEKLTDEHSVGKIQPHFVAIADTHAWNFQAVKFAEAKLGGFVANIYDSEPNLEQTDKYGGKYFTWTAQDGRKAYALVIDSLIYFTNDATAIDKCLAVKRGEADSIAKDGKVKPSDPATLASGYISTDGVAQIANIAALKFASDASDESEIQSAIAGIVPKLVRGTITDATWTQTKTDTSLQDTWQINMPSDVANVFNETMVAVPPETMSVNFLSKPFSSATRYCVRDPLAALQAGFHVAKNIDPSAGKLFAALVGATFAEYGIDKPEQFLAALGPQIITARMPLHQGSVAIGHAVDLAKLEGSVSEAFAFNGHLAGDERRVVDSRDGTLRLKNFEGAVVIGDLTAANLSSTGSSAVSNVDVTIAERFFKSRDAVAVTYEEDDGDECVAVLGVLAGGGLKSPTMSGSHFTETRFIKSGMERKTTSDFGFIGWIIAQLADD